VGLGIHPADLVGLYRYDGHPGADAAPPRLPSSMPTTLRKGVKDHFPIVYTSTDGYVAHECIIDLRDLKEATGIGVEDVAKRLVDYGFHAPTMSWPVPETLMIEPTESECQDEIDRFCEAMISIRQEIAELEDGKADAKDNVLAQRTPHPSRPAGRLDEVLLARARLLSAEVLDSGQVLATGCACRQRLWRPQSGLYLPAR
jgi:hypothetical protein